jgi:hypothetical protein
VTFAAAGSLIQQGSLSTFALTPVGIGNLIVIEVINESNNTVFPTALSSTNVTWTPIGTSFAGTTNAFTARVFFGKVTSTSSATVTITWSGTTPTSMETGGQEFTSTVGSWALDVQGQFDTTAVTSTWPSLTPAGAGELYFGHDIDNGVAVAGSTTGYTYDITTSSNGVAFNPACTSAAQAPVWGDSGHLFGIVVLVKETPAAARPRALLRGQTAARKGMLTSILIKPPTTTGPPAKFFPPHALLRGAASAAKGRLTSARGRGGQPAPFKQPGTPLRGQPAAAKGKLTSARGRGGQPAPFRPGILLRGPAAARKGKLTGLAAPPPVLHPAVTSPFTAPPYPLRGRAAPRKSTLAGLAAPPPVAQPNVPAPFFPPHALNRGPRPATARTPLTGKPAPPPPPPPPVLPRWQGATHMVAASEPGNLIQGSGHTGPGGPDDIKGDFQQGGD